MLWTPRSGGGKIITNHGIVGTTSPGTGVPSNATTLLDGAVTELISAANNTMESWGIGIWVFDAGASATASEAALDILIGGATDDVLIPALLCGASFLGGSPGCFYFFPVHVPGGVRIAAQLASVRTSITARVVVKLYGGGAPPWRVGRKVTAYGTQANNARGQSITPATSGGAASATQLTASTNEDHFYFHPGFQPETDATMQGNQFVNVGIGIGAATEERIGTWDYILLANETMTGPLPPMGVWRDVPAGTRLTMLASNVLAANDDAYGGLIYAVG